MSVINLKKILKFYFIILQKAGLSGEQIYFASIKKGAIKM